MTTKPDLRCGRGPASRSSMHLNHVQKPISVSANRLLLWYPSHSSSVQIRHRHRAGRRSDWPDPLTSRIVHNRRALRQVRIDQDPIDHATSNGAQCLDVCLGESISIGLAGLRGRIAHEDALPALP